MRNLRGRPQKPASYARRQQEPGDIVDHMLQLDSVHSHGDIAEEKAAPIVERPETACRDLFEGCPEKHVKAFLSRGQVQRRPAGAYFFCAGEATPGFHLLQSGRVRIYQITGCGRQTLLRHVSPGEAFGLWTLLPLTAHRVCAQALQDSRALVWERATIIQLIRSNARLSYNILLMAACHLSELRERHVYMATQSAPRRIAWALKALGEQIGHQAEERIVITDGFREKDLAEMAGVTLHTVSRVLSRWERQGALTKSRGRIAVLRPALLRELTEDVG